ncbi:MAG: hypothetical protein Q8940_17385 [Bacteroidota bacterium]|nr:hypothetical protein [Bacteroidota bacterium]
MTPIFLAVHKQAALQAKDYDGKFNQFDSTKPFYIYSGYNFQGIIREMLLENLPVTDSSGRDDKLFGNKVFVAQSSKFLTIDTLPKWDNIYKRMKPFQRKLDNNLNHTTFREYENSGEFNYHLVRMLKPVFNKKKNVYSTELHITDNVFENDGYYYSLKFRIFDNKIKVVNINQYEICIGLPPL